MRIRIIKERVQNREKGKKWPVSVSSSGKERKFLEVPGVALGSPLEPNFKTRPEHFPVE